MQLFKNNTPFDIQKLKRDKKFLDWYTTFDRNVEEVINLTFAGAVGKDDSFYSILIEVVFRYSGSTLVRSILLRGRSVVVIPVFFRSSLENSSFLVVEQLRVNNGRTCLEFPAGGVDENLSLAENALRELNEETGVIATSDELVILGEDLVVCESALDETTTWFMLFLDSERLTPGVFGRSLEGERTESLMVEWIDLNSIQTFHMIVARGLLRQFFEATRVWRA